MKMEFKKIIYNIPIIIVLLLMSSVPSGAVITQLYQKNGSAAGDGFGYNVASAGDVNNDGYVDFIVGAYKADPSGRTNAGSAYVYSGLNGNLLYQKDGAAAEDRFGISVNGAGDANNDGYDDFIVGAWQADPSGNSNAGSAYVYSGFNGNLLFQKNGGASEDRFGVSVAGVGDYNNDGYDDVIIGAYKADPSGLIDAGSAYIYSGNAGGLLLTKNGAATGDNFGISVAGIGDVNGDGRPDFIVGANMADPGGILDAGSAYVFSGNGGGQLYQKNGSAAWDGFGTAVGTAGDVNADGRPDFIVGAPYADPSGSVDAGAVYVYSGDDGSLRYSKYGAAESDNFGISVAGAGDANEDGRADFIIGAWQADPGSISNAGSAYLYSGGDGSLLYQKNGDTTLDNLGVSVANITNVKHDGKSAIIIGSYNADPSNVFDAGSTYEILYDLLLPTQSAWSPSSGTLMKTLTPTVTFSTNEAADCKWAQTDLAYGSMTNDCTGDGTMSQSCATSLNEGTAPVYISCLDAYEDADTIATNHLLTYTTDVTLPEFSSAVAPATSTTLTTLTPSITFSITENGDCKWSLTDLAYSAMGGDCTGDGGSSQSCAVTGLTQGPSKTIYIACRDTADNQDTDLSNEHITYNNIDLTTLSRNSWSPANNSLLMTAAPTITFTTNEAGDCKWSQTSQAYAAMTNDCTGDGATSQTCSTSGLPEGAASVYIACQDSYLNNDLSPINDLISYTIDLTLPELSAPVSPASGTLLTTTSPTVTFTTTENADCKWSQTDEAYTSMTSDCTGDGSQNQSCAMSSLPEGPSINVYISCKDTAGNADAIASNELLNYSIDTLPIAQSNWAPLTGSYMNTTTPTVTFSTNENGDCKWSQSALDYSAMAGDCTGDGATSQSCAVTGLLEGPVSIYTTCRDSHANTTTDSARHQLDYTIDLTLPLISGGVNPATGTVITTTSPTIAFTTNENSTCRWSVTDQSYAAMTGTCAGSGATSQSCEVSGLVQGPSITAYIACRDTAGNQDSATSNKHLTYDVDVTTITQSGWSPVTGTYMNTTEPVITFGTNENGECKWSQTDQAYSAMTGDCTGDGTTSQTCSVTELTEGARSIYITCRDSFGNTTTDTASHRLDYIIDLTLPLISGAANPSAGVLLTTTSPTISFTMDENSTCKWSVTDQAYSTMTGTCAGGGATSQSCAASGLAEGPSITAYIACRDTAGNEDSIASNKQLTYPLDTLLIAQSGWSPATGMFLNTTTPVMTFNTNENGDCKWSQSELDYSAMQGDCTGDGTQNQTCPVTGLIEGPASIYITCRDIYGNTTTDSARHRIDYTIDLTLPKISGGVSPATGTLLVTTSPTVTFTTDENSSCKWSLSDQDYSVMLGDCTGDGTPDQSCAIAGLAQGPSVTAYVTCKDTAGNEDTTTFSEHLTYTIDVIALSKSNWNPANHALLRTASPSLSFSTNENGDCKWSFSDLAYSAMTNDCDGDGTQNQTCSLTGLPEGAATVYVACRDSYLNADTATSNDRIDYTIDLTLPDITGEITPANGAFLTTASPALTFSTTENADCKWSLTDQTYSDMTSDCTGDGSTTQSCAITIPQGPSVSAYIACRDTAGNQDTVITNDKVTYTVDVTALAQSEWNPPLGSYVTTSDPVIAFTTNENADCKWSMLDQSYSAMTNDCTGDGTQSQSCPVTALPDGPVALFIACRDSFLNEESASANSHLTYNIDTVNPNAGGMIVADGDWSKDIDYSNKTNSFTGRWTAASDITSGLARYWYSIGTTRGGTEAADWTSAGLTAFVTRTGLTLTIGQTYYLSVKAEDAAGLFSSIATSDGVMIVPSSSICGDFDGDGNLASNDVLALYQHLNKTGLTLTGAQLARADVSLRTESGDPDGAVISSDLTLISDVSIGKAGSKPSDLRCPANP